MISLPPIRAALEALEKEMGEKIRFTTYNPQQEILATLLPLYAGGRIPAEGIASSHKETVLAFLRERGIEMDLAGDSEGGIKMAGFMRVDAKWQNPGTDEAIATDTPAGIVRGIKLEKGAVMHLSIFGHPHIVSRLATQDEEVFLYLTPSAGFEDEFGLAKKVQVLSSALRDGAFRYLYGDELNGLIFPSTDFALQSELPQLKGMGVTTSRYIDFAVAKNYLKLDKYGAQVKSAFYGSTRGISLRKEPLVIKQPYLIWGEMNGIVYFAAYVSWESWEKAEKKAADNRRSA